MASLVHTSIRSGSGCPWAARPRLRHHRPRRGRPRAAARHQRVARDDDGGLARRRVVGEERRVDPVALELHIDHLDGLPREHPVVDLREDVLAHVPAAWLGEVCV